jgi:hypothetical protein
MVGVQPVGIGSVDDEGAVVIGELLDDTEATADGALDEVEVTTDEEGDNDSHDEGGVVVRTLLTIVDDAVKDKSWEAKTEATIAELSDNATDIEMEPEIRLEEENISTPGDNTNEEEIELTTIDDTTASDPEADADNEGVRSNECVDEGKTT